MIAHRIATCTGLETRECCGTSGGWRQLKRVEQRRDKLQVQVRLAQNCSPTRWTWHVTRMNVDTRPEVLPTPSCSPPSFAPHSPLSSCGTSDSSVRVGKRLVYTLYELSCVGGSTKFANIHFRQATQSRSPCGLFLLCVLASTPASDLLHTISGSALATCRPHHNGGQTRFPPLPAMLRLFSPRGRRRRHHQGRMQRQRSRRMSCRCCSVPWV